MQDSPIRNSNNNNRYNQQDQEEIIQFYQTQLVHLKELLYSQTEKIQQLTNDNKVQQMQIANLKDNNASLSHSFGEISQINQNKLTTLEERMVTLSVDRAEKEIELDIRERDQKLLEKEMLISNLVQQIDQLSVSSNNTQLDMQRKESDQEGNLIEKQNVKNAKISEKNIGEAFNQQNKQLSAEQLDMTNDQFYELKQSNKSYLSLFDSFKSALNKGESLREKNRQNFQLMIENLPKSVYNRIYEQELDKLKDNKGKAAEVQIWETDVMSLFIKQQKNEARIHEKIGQYIRNFFPEQFRGKLWKFLVGNDQRITKLLYNKYLESIPNHPMVTEELLNLINSDLKRTFQIINNYDNQQKLKDDLREILIIFHLFRPDMGYIQGMTYIAFMFLIRMDKIKAYKCFINLIYKSKLLKSIYSFKQNQIDAYFQTFNYFLNEKLPEIGKHMQYHNIPQQMFLVEWFFTLYSRAFNLVMSSMIWDQFLYEGDVYIFRVSLAILSLIQDDLLQCDYEDTLIMIRSCSVKLNDSDLFKAIKQLKINRTSFQSRYEKELTTIFETSQEKEKI